MQNSLFKDLKVVELASVLAGPSVGLMFAEMGAEVIKIENAKSGGDVTRAWKLKGESGERSAYYASVNAGKQSLMKDLSKPAQLNEVYRLLSNADVVIVNFKHGAALKLGLDYERVKNINPQIIYGEITGFESNPKRVAYDVVMQAETGWMSMNGQGNSPPTKLPVALMDVLAGHQLKEGILAALWRKEKTGKGCKVACSLEASSIASLFNQASNYLNAGHEPKRIGSLHPNIAPYGDIFACGDGKEVVLAVGSDSQFAHLCELLGNAHIPENPIFTTNANRVLNRLEMQEKLAPLFQKKSRDEWLALFIQSNVPAGAIRGVGEVLESEFVKQKLLTQSANMQATRSVAFRIEG